MPEINTKEMTGIMELMDYLEQFQNDHPELDVDVVVGDGVVELGNIGVYDGDALFTTSKDDE